MEIIIDKLSLTQKVSGSPCSLSFPSPSSSFSLVSPFLSSLSPVP